MTRYGFHASHEQIAPSQLLRDVRRAEQAGFEMAMCSDHFAPWSMSQGHSGFAWSWLGAALASTDLSFGTVCAPGQRYHPAVIAQASATLAEMFPDRFWVALGTGQNMNEHVTGDPWPTKDERQRRLEECVDVIRDLHAGQEVSRTGEHVQVDRARVYSLPVRPPALIGPALTPRTAARAARWADGLITINADVATVREIISAYRDAGGRGPVSLQVHVSIAETMSAAWQIARDQWRNHGLGAPRTHDTPVPEEFDRLGSEVSDEELSRSVVVTDDLEDLIAQLRAYGDLGIDDVYLHHVGVDQDPFLELAEAELLPRLRRG